MMVYEHSKDNRVLLNEARHPAWCKTIRSYISEMFYPSILRVNKQINAEFTPLCFSKATLCVVYTPYDHDPGDYDLSFLPILSKWFKIRANVLARIQHVKFHIEVGSKLPNFSQLGLFNAPFHQVPRLQPDPFEGILDCISELSSLKHISVWAQVPISVVESDIETGGEGFEMLISYLDEVDTVLYYMTACSGRGFTYAASFDIYCPLYSLTASTALSFGRDLQCRDVPAPGLPEWGYAFFIETSNFEHEPNDFNYHNATLRFDCIEYDFHTPN